MTPKAPEVPKAKPTTVGFNAAAREVHEVDPERFEFARWDDEAQRDIGGGDIRSSYSADLIAMTGKVRKPFMFRGQTWVCTSGGGMAQASTAYQLVPLDHFEGGEAVSYAEKTDDCAAARADPDGFYHGMTVQHRGQPHVLCGPPVNFVPGPVIQPGLFAGT